MTEDIGYLIAGMHEAPSSAGKLIIHAGMGVGVGELERKLCFSPTRLRLRHKFQTTHGGFTHVKLFQSALSTSSQEVATEHVVVAVVESDGFYLALLRSPAQSTLKVGAAFGFLQPHCSGRGKTAVRSSDERERGEEFEIKTNARQPRVRAVRCLLAHLSTATRIGLRIVFFQQRYGFVARTCCERQRSSHPFQQRIARPSASCGECIRLTAG